MIENYTKKLSLVTVLSSLAIALEIVKSISPGGFVLLAGIEPVTLLVALGGTLLGPLYGFFQGLVTNLLYSFFLGVSVILPFTALGFGLIGFLAGLLQKYLKNDNQVILGLMGFSYSLLFDLLTNIAHAFLFNIPIEVSLIAGFLLPPFIGVKHLISNFILFSFVFPILKKKIELIVGV